MTKVLNDLELQELEWVAANGWQRSFDLKDGDGEVVARLTRPTWWNSIAEIEAPGNRWRFEPYGFWKRNLTASGNGASGCARSALMKSLPSSSPIAGTRTRGLCNLRMGAASTGSPAICGVPNGSG